MTLLQEILRESKDITDHVVYDKNNFWADREDADTGKILIRPGDKVKFTYNNKKMTGVISNKAKGRDNDVYKIVNVENEISK